MAHGAGKRAYIGETWRCPVPESDEEQGFTTHCERLDALWVRALTAYARDRNLASISPFFTNLFFLYTAYPQSRDYWEELSDAIARGRRTGVHQAYQETIRTGDGGKWGNGSGR